MLTASDGTFHLMQLIWQGRTAEVHARVAGAEVNPQLLQQHRDGSHFQNADTWKEFMDFFVLHISPLRNAITAERGFEQAVLLVVDAASQHTYKPDVPWLYLVGIPESMTHVFQPADQLVIPNVKQGSDREYKTWIES